MNRKLGILIFILLFSCNPKMQKDIEYSYLLKQKSLDGKYNIYSYWRTGMMAFSSDIYGTQIQKSNEEFHEGLGIKIKGEILRYIGKDTIEVYRKQLGQHPTDTIPTIRYEKAYDLILKILDYDGHNGGTSRELFFDEIDITGEKIIFKGVRVELTKEYRDNIIMDLGSVCLEKKADTISQIRFTTLKASMDGRFKNPNGIFDENLPSIKRITNYLIPSGKIHSESYEKLNGIYYDIKKTTGNNGNRCTSL